MITKQLISIKLSKHLLYLIKNRFALESLLTFVKVNEKSAPIYTINTIRFWLYL